MKRNANPLPKPLLAWLLYLATNEFTTVERAVLCALLAAPQWHIDNWQELWERYTYRYREMSPNRCRLPYTEQGIRKACKALAERKVIQTSFRDYHWRHASKAALTLPVEPPVAAPPGNETSGSTGSARNKQFTAAAVK